MEGRYSNNGFSDEETETNLSTQINMEEPKKVEKNSNKNKPAVVLVLNQSETKPL